MDKTGHLEIEKTNVASLRDAQSPTKNTNKIVLSNVKRLSPLYRRFHRSISFAIQDSKERITRRIYIRQLKNKSFDSLIDKVVPPARLAFPESPYPIFKSLRPEG